MDRLFFDLIEILRIREHDRLSHIPLRKGNAHIGFVVRDLQVLHKVLLHKLILDIPQLHHHAPGPDRRQERIRILRKEHDHRILRRFLDRLKERVLGLYAHKIRVRDDIDLILTAVRADHDIVIYLHTDIVHADRIGLLVGNPDNIRLVAAESLSARLALPACISVFVPVLALKAHSKQIGKQFLP